MEGTPQPDEAHIWVHVPTGRKTPINPEWPAIYADDPVFDILKSDFGVTRNRLLRLVQGGAGVVDEVSEQQRPLGSMGSSGTSKMYLLA